MAGPAHIDDRFSWKARNGEAAGATGRMSQWLEPLEDAANLIAAAAIFLLMVLGVLEIGKRKLLNAPLTGYIDLAEHSMASMALLGAAYCQTLGAHISMERLAGRQAERAA